MWKIFKTSIVCVLLAATLQSFCSHVACNQYVENQISRANTPEQNAIYTDSPYNSSKPPDISAITLITYVLMNKIEKGKTKTWFFENGVRKLCQGYEQLGDKSWKTKSLLTDTELLYKKMKSSLAGQRYIRFPRASLAYDDSVKLRFLDPLIYGINTSEVLISKNDRRYKYHRDAIIRRGEEFVEILNGRHSDFDWDLNWNPSSTTTAP